MTKVVTSTELPVSADVAWTMIGGWNALADWHPGVVKSTLEKGGTVRRIDVGGSAAIVEELISHDDRTRTYSYKIVTSPEPVKNYIGMLKVSPSPRGCVVEWSSEFDPVGPEAAAIQEIRDAFEQGLANLRKMFGGG